MSSCTYPIRTHTKTIQNTPQTYITHRIDLRRGTLPSIIANNNSAIAAAPTKLDPDQLDLYNQTLYYSHTDKNIDLCIERVVGNFLSTLVYGSEAPCTDCVNPVCALPNQLRDCIDRKTDAKRRAPSNAIATYRTGCIVAARSV